MVTFDLGRVTTVQIRKMLPSALIVVTFDLGRVTTVTILVALARAIVVTFDLGRVTTRKVIFPIFALLLW